jgi:uncharacterized protein
MTPPKNFNAMRKDFSMGSLRSLHHKETMEAFAPVRPTDDELFAAIFSQDLKNAYFALRLGANPNAMTEGGRTALAYAVSFPKLAIARMLLEFGADINFKNGQGLTALMIEAFLPSSLFGIRFLLENGADTDAVDDHGETALMLAISSRQFAKAELLVDHGADVTVKDHSGKTALDLLKGVKGEAARGLRELLLERA